MLIPPGNISQSQAVCLTKIPLKQPLESFAMSCLIPCHLMHGIMNRIQISSLKNAVFTRNNRKTKVHF